MKIKSEKTIPQGNANPSHPRILFMGTSLFAKKILCALVENKLDVVAVYAQPDKKSGRKNQIAISPVKEYCLKNDLKLFQPDKLDANSEAHIRSMSPSLIVVAAYGKILPQNILSIPESGCMNVHASLLPKYRGASPIQSAILAGDDETGVTVMLMDKNIDTGDILSRAEINIDSDDTTETLSLKLADLGASQILKTIPVWIQGKIIPQKQDDLQSIPCQLVKRDDGHISWSGKATDIYNKFRAFQSWPGVFSFWKKNGKVLRLKLKKISLEINMGKAGNSAGRVFSEDGKIFVQTSSGSIALIEVQLEGKNPIAIKDFTNGHPDFVGSVLE